MVMRSDSMMYTKPIWDVFNFQYPAGFPPYRIFKVDNPLGIRLDIYDSAGY